MPALLTAVLLRDLQLPPAGQIERAEVRQGYDPIAQRIEARDQAVWRKRLLRRRR
jgi:hypothetical protein